MTREEAAARRSWRRARTRQRRRNKTAAFYQQIAPGAVEDPRYPWPRLALQQFRVVEDPRYPWRPWIDTK